MHNDKRCFYVWYIACKKFMIIKATKEKGLYNTWASKRKNSRLSPPLSMPTKEIYEVISLKYTWC